jgi:chitinase
VHSRSTPFLRTISCEKSQKKTTIAKHAGYILVPVVSLALLMRVSTMAKLPPYHPTFYIILLCLSASLGVHSALAPNHDSSPNSCNSTQVGGTTDAGESSQHNGYRHVAYYVVSSTIPATASACEPLTNPWNYAIYARDHPPQDVPADKLTHLLYAFANIHPVTGEISLSDANADTDKRFSTDSTGEIGNNLFGCLKQIYLLKKRNRNLKVLLSIGGGSSNASFAVPASTPEGRRRFAQSAVAMLKDLPFDGLDVDWEYPETPEQGCHLAELLAVTRKEMDDYAASLPSKPHFSLTIASPAGPQNFPNLPFREIDSHLDFWNLMAYDYAGPWDKVAAHQANIFPSESSPQGTPFSTDDAINHYIGQGVSADKIVMGMPLYGRAFQRTAGPGASFSGVGGGSFVGQDGVWSYKVRSCHMS